MKQEYLQNVRHNGTKIFENSQDILYKLTETYSLITGKKCEYSTLYEGTVFISIEGEETITCKKYSEAVITLITMVDKLYE